LYSLYPLEHETPPDNRKYYVVEIALDDVTLTGVLHYALCTTFMPENTYAASVLVDKDSAAIAAQAVTGIRILRELTQSECQQMGDEIALSVSKR
jgi:hypothetical protein